MDAAIHYIALASTISFLACFTALPLLCIFRKTRRVAGVGYVVSSYIFGLSLWVVSAMTVYLAWGGLAVLIGIFIIGIGVLPMALWISAWDGQWFALATAAIMLVSAMGTRFLGVWLASQK
jgi:hypothetical protein